VSREDVREDVRKRKTRSMRVKKDRNHPKRVREIGKKTDLALFHTA